VRPSRRETALVVVDVQERLFGAMEPEQREGMVRNLKILRATARRLGMPVPGHRAVPEGLGHTLPEVREALGAVEPTSKVAFSCGAVEPPPGCEHGARAVVLAGLETRLRPARPRSTFSPGTSWCVPGDATVSRTRQNWEFGLALLRSQGALVTTTETVVFQLLGQADSEDFRALAPLLK
jgi:hypothetical protein